MINGGDSTKGTTMVEVIVAFAMLLLIMGIFSQALTMSGSMLKRADRVLTDTRQLIGDYYQTGDGDEAFQTEAAEENWIFSGKEDGSFQVKAKLRSYENPDGHGVIYDVLPTEAAPEH